MSKKNLYFFVVLIIVFCVACSKKSVKLENPVEKSLIFEERDSFGYSQISSDNNFFYIINRKKNTDIVAMPYLYVIANDYRYNTNVLKNTQSKFVSQSDIEFYCYNIYSLKDGKKIKTIDVNKLLEKAYPDYQPSVGLRLNLALYKGIPCLKTFIEKRPQSSEDINADSMKVAYIDIEEERVFLEDNSLDKQNRWRNEIYLPNIKTYDVLNLGKSNSLLAINGLEKAYVYPAYIEGSCCIYIPLDLLPTDNEYLDNIFPELKTQVQEVLDQESQSEGDSPIIQIYITDNPTPERILKLILGEDKEINFSGWKIDSKNSVDGKEHDIYSFEEFYQYWNGSNVTIDESEFLPLLPEIE